MNQPIRLLNRNFFLLWQGQLVSQLGNQVHGIAMMFWLKHATGSAGLMGTLMMLSMLPGVLLGPIGGTVADNFSRRKIIIASDIICGLAVLSLAGLLLCSPENISLAVVWLFVAGILVGTVSAFFRPAITAAIPDLVPTDKVAAANSMNQSSFQISSLLGQGAGGVLYRVLGAPVLFLIDGLTYLFSAISEMFIIIPQNIPEKTPGFKPIMRKFLTDTAVGFDYVWRNRGMKTVFLTAAVLNFLISPVVVLLPFYVEDHLKTTSDWFGFMIAALGAGSLIGYALAGMLKIAGKTRSLLLILFLILLSLDFALLGISGNRFFSLLLFLIMGIMTGVININIITVLQVMTPGEIRGRVFGLLGTITGGLMPIGMGLAGAVSEILDNNIPLIFIICGLAMAGVNIVMAFDKHFREFLACEINNNNNTESKEE
nr:MFS transporter [candidate division Zixibacteria bacterium]